MISVDGCADGGGGAHDDGGVRVCGGGSVERLQKWKRLQVLEQNLRLERVKQLQELGRMVQVRKHRV